MKKSQVLAWGLCALLAGALGYCGYRLHGSDSRRKKYKERIKQLKRFPWENKDVSCLAETRRDIERRNPKNVHERIVAARKYVREAFVVKYDDWYKKNKYNMPVVLETLYRRHHIPKARLAHLDCQPACRALACILHHMDLQTRLVGFLTDDFDYVASHACIEVLNPETKSWELHDVLYDIHFLDRDSRQVLAAADLVFGPLDKVVPTNGQDRGWKNVCQYGKAPRLRDHYYEVLAYNHPTRRCFVLINTDRVSLSKTFPKNDGLNMIGFLNMVYAAPPILGLPNGRYLTLPNKAGKR